MNYTTIRYSLRDTMGVIALNRPEALNTLDAQMRAEVTHAVRRASQEARVVVMTGKGKAFCSGQDLGDGRDAGTLNLERTLREEILPLITAIRSCPVPTLAAVNGTAAGTGAMLALAADVTIATESAKFIQAHTRIGLMPDGGATSILPERIGTARAMGAMLFGDAISARQAADWGMIYEAVPDADFADHWAARAQHLGAGPTQAYAGIKAAVAASAGNTLEEQLTLEARLQGDCGKSRDFQEGMLAFVEQRRAGFEGR